MATSPLQNDMDYVSFDILLDGNPLKGTYDILSIEIHKKIHRIPSAVFTVLLPIDIGGGKSFAASESEDFLPGTEVEIKLGYESKTDSVFKGIIIRHGIKSETGERPQLILHCQDKAVKMTVYKKVQAFQQQSDAQIIESIISNNGLEKNVVATKYVHPQLLQTGVTDWDFIVTRAEANGLISYADAGKVMVKKPLASGKADLVLSFDQDVFDFEAEMDAGYQLPVVKALSWDYSKGKFVSAKSQEPTINKQGNISGKKLSEVLGTAGVGMPFTTPMSTKELEGIAEGILLRSRLAALRGRVSFFGSAKPQLNTLIELKGFGNRFDGAALISSIKHTLREGEWRTEIGFGLPATFFAERHPAATSSASLLPSVRGLQNGVVTSNEDPKKEAQIQVNIPVLSTTLWARHASFYATTGKGVWFQPEVGDEVIVGFLNDDPRFPIILGSLYSAKNAPPYVADEKNSIKAIITKNDLKIELNDEEKILTIQTPAGNKFTLSDKDKSITVIDQNKNTLTMDSSGITLKSDKNITLDAGGNINLKAKQNISGAATGGDVSLKGNNVNGDGKIGVKMKGGATAELSAGGQTTVKGAMVMIN